MNMWKFELKLRTFTFNTIHMYSGITSGRVLDGELLYPKILEVNLFAFAYRLFHRDFSTLNGFLSTQRKAPLCTFTFM